MKPRKPGNIYRIWNIDTGRYLAIGYSSKTTWRQLSAAIEAARNRIKYARRDGRAVERLEVHEFPVQQTPSVIYSIEE